MVATVRGKVEAPGEFTVPAKLIADYVGSLTSERVDLEQKSDTLEISGGASRTKIKGIPAAEFPLIPALKRDGAPTFRVPAGDLKKALSRVLFAVSTNESRPEISGVYLKFDPKGPAGTLTLAATDSYRLAEATLALHEAPTPDAGERSVIVPSRTLAELGRILGAGSKAAEDAPATVEIVLADNQILFMYGGAEIISRLIEGQYPAYRAVIPESGKTTAAVARDALLGAVKTASLFSRSGLFDVHLAIQKTGGIVVSAADAQTGENETELVATVQGEDNKATLNHRYLVEGLSAMDAPEVTLRLIDGVNPCLIQPATQTPGQHYLYVVMPIKQ